MNTTDHVTDVKDPCRDARNSIEQPPRSIHPVDVADLHWMARRYADGRQSYATSLFNDITRRLLVAGWSIGSVDGTPWARDGGGRAFDGLTAEEAELGREPDWTHDGLQRRAERAENDNAALRAALEEIERHSDEAITCVEARAALAGTKCEVCDGTGITRSLGRDNDEIIEDCPKCAALAGGKEATT